MKNFYHTPFYLKMCFIAEVSIQKVNVGLKYRIQKKNMEFEKKKEKMYRGFYQ